MQNSVSDSGVSCVSLNEISGWTMPTNDASSQADHLATPISKLLREELSHRGRQRYLDHFSEAEGLKTINALDSRQSTGSDPTKAFNHLVKG